MVRKAALGAVVIVSSFSLGLVAADDSGEQTLLQKLGITPSPGVCSGCEAEQVAYNAALSDLNDAYDVFNAAESDLLDCQYNQRGTENTGESILVGKLAD